MLHTLNYLAPIFYSNHRFTKVIKPYPHVHTNIFTSSDGFGKVTHRAQKAETKWCTVDIYARVTWQNLTGK